MKRSHTALKVYVSVEQLANWHSVNVHSNIREENNTIFKVKWVQIAFIFHIYFTVYCGIKI